MGYAVDDIQLHNAVREHLQSPAGVAFGRLRAGELGDLGLDFSGDPDRVRRCFAGLALQGGERADLAAAFAKALDGAGRKPGDPDDFGILFTGAVRAFVGKEQTKGVHRFPDRFGGFLPCGVVVAYGFESETFVSRQFDAVFFGRHLSKNTNSRVRASLKSKISVFFDFM